MYKQTVGGDGGDGDGVCVCVDLKQAGPWCRGSIPVVAVCVLLSVWM